MAYACPSVTVTSTLPPQSSGSPLSCPSSLTWKRSPTFALPFEQDLVTVTFGDSFKLFVIVQSVVPAAPSVIEYATPAVTLTSVVPAQSSGSPTLEVLRFTWKRSPSAPLPFGHDFVTVTFGAALRVFVSVQLAVSPKWARVPEQPALTVRGKS